MEQNKKASCSEWLDRRQSLLDIFTYLERNLLWVVERNVIPRIMIFAIQLQGRTSAVITTIVYCVVKFTAGVLRTHGKTNFLEN